MKSKNVMVVGGAGFIGSHTVDLLRKRGFSVVVVDSFIESRMNVIQDAGIVYYEVDIRDKNELKNVFEETRPDIVFHFAALTSVPDSVQIPSDYYDVNIIGGINVLECMRHTGVRKIVFSSSAAVYGEPQSYVISEDHPKNPTSPYGQTKLMFENILSDYHRAYNISSVSLRFFCAAGCDISSGVGEYHKKKTMLFLQ